MKSPRTLRDFGKGARPFVLLILIWVAASAFARVPEYALPSLGKVVTVFLSLLEQGQLPDFIRGSLLHLMLATCAGLLLAIPFGLLVGMNRLVARFFYPIFNFMQSLPAIAWLPLLIVWFGFSNVTIVTVIAYSVAFPVVFSTIVGVRTIPTVYKSAVLTMGGSRWDIVTQVILPGALPNIITGMRLGIAFGWRALIAAEMIVGANGLGFMIFEAQRMLLTDRIVLGMIVIGFLWTVIDSLVLRPLEAVTIERWGVQR